MIVLKILLAILILIILVLCIKIRITADYDDEISLSVGALFLNFNILPIDKEKRKAKKEKKEKKAALKAEKEKAKNEKSRQKKKADKPATQPVPERKTDNSGEKNVSPKTDSAAETQNKPDSGAAKPSKKKDNMFIRFYNNKGFDGVMELIGNTGKALKGMFGRVIRAFVFDELQLYITTSGSDSADTAIKYGKVSGYVFPAMGYITSKMKVKKYDLAVKPDFIGGQNKAQFHFILSFRTIKLVGAVIVVAFELLFKVLIKFIKNSRKG